MKAGEWTLRSRRVATPSGLRPADIVIRDESIAKLLPHDGPESEGVILDVGNLVVLPGLVALHRGKTQGPHPGWFDAATRDCSAGGVTTLIDLPPSHSPNPTDPGATFRRMAVAGGRIRVDCGLVVPLGRGQVERIGSWIEAGFLGVEAIFEDVGRVQGSDSIEADLGAAMPILANLGRPLIVDFGRIDRPPGPRNGSDNFDSSISEPELAAIRLLIRLCRETRCQVHLICSSASEPLLMFAEARVAGLPLTIETRPRHLGSALGERIDRPPSRSLDSGHDRPTARDRVWEALESGLIGSIGPDPDLRGLASPGRPGDEVASPPTEAGPLRLALPSVWAEVQRRGLAIDHLGRWMSGRTARVMGLESRKGSIAPGQDADLVVFDPDAGSSTDRHGPKPLVQNLLGRVEATILRGTMIYQDGEFVPRPSGSVILRLEETQPMPGTNA